MSFSSLIPRCIPKDSKSDCLTFAWTANDIARAQPIIDRVSYFSFNKIQILQLTTDNKIPASEVRFFNSTELLNQFIFNSPNVTQAGLVLNISTIVIPIPFTNLTTSLTTYNYTLIINQTDIFDDNLQLIDRTRYIVLPLQVNTQNQISNIIL